MPASAQLLVILVALVAFWAVVMRPARNQQRKVQQLQAELLVGQEVVLSAGIFGTIRALTDTRAEVEVAPGVVLTVARQVVVRRVEDLEDTAPASQDPADDHAAEPAAEHDHPAAPSAGTDLPGTPGDPDGRGPGPVQDQEK